MPTSGRKSTLALLLLVAVSVVLSGLAAQAESSFSGTNGMRFGSGSGLSPDDITLGNAVATSCLGVTTCTTPALTNIDAGDTLIVIVTEHTTTAGNPSSVVEVTSGGNNPMTLLGSSGCTVLGHGVVATYGLADVAAQASVTFTVTYAAAEYYTIHVLDVEGTSASPFETAGTPVCSSAAGTTASASVTTTVADDLVILGVEVRADESIAASGGDTVVTLQEIGGASSDSGSMLDEFDSGTGSITLSATFGSAQWAALAIALKPGLIAGVVSPATAAIDASQSVALTSTAASGGSGSYAYQWYNGPATCSSGTAIPGATTLAYTTPPLPVGTDYYCVEATDSTTLQVAYSNVAVITVNPALSVTITPAAPSIDSGQTITLTANPSGGTGADSYAWYSGATCSGPVLATTQSYTPSALSSTTTFCVAAADSADRPVTTTATDIVTVSSSSLSVTITPSTPSIDNGQSITLTANPSGGTGADTYAWYAGATCSGTVLATSQAYFTAALTASATYCVSVTDSAYQPATATATDTVTVSSVPLTVAITPAQPSIDRGQTITLTAEPSGGTGADSYAWYAGGTCSGSVIATTQSLSTPKLNASTTYCVTVTDSSADPANATATATVTVTAVAPTGSGNGGGSGLFGILSSAWWLLLLLVIVMLLLLLLVARRRRKKEPPTPAAAGMPSLPTAGVGAAATPGLPESPAPSSAVNESTKNDEASENSSSVGSSASPPPTVPPAEAAVEPEPVPLGTPPPTGGGPEPTPAPPSPASDDLAPAADSTAPGPPVPQSPAPEASAEPRTLGDWLFRAPATEGEDPQE